MTSTTSRFWRTSGDVVRRRRDVRSIKYSLKDSSVDGCVSAGAPFFFAYDLFSPQNLVNLYTGIGFDNATVWLYATNVFIKLYVQNQTSSADAAHPAAFVPVRPRTIGLSVEYEFGC